MTNAFVKTVDNREIHFYRGAKPVARAIGEAGQAMVLRRSNGSTWTDWADLIRLVNNERFLPFVRHFHLSSEESVQLMNMIPEEEQK